VGPADVCRALFWVAMTNGAAGHTYGGNGIWQVNRPDEPYGPSPGGHNWGTLPWSEAMKLPGSAQMAVGKRLLTGYPWWRFEPRVEWSGWAEPPVVNDAAALETPSAAGIAGKIRIVYAPQPRAVVVRSLESGVDYRAWRVNVETGQRSPAGDVTRDGNSSWRCPPPEKQQDWLLILESR
jgi:hypothetical protein